MRGRTDWGPIDIATYYVGKGSPERELRSSPKAIRIGQTPQGFEKVHHRKRHWYHEYNRIETFNNFTMNYNV
ncbi:hypothetical protein BTUL_0227g00060 [Botrytis tulipae]|uniref:Uncharacterized protein n=1 Tax=Botrytis tulipae TaxID=87230 RepID=A0A4Z1EC42_9HELO|nr:hypothetical protein BTUL_0227g00060 [Botrytis tulipae]